MTAAMTATLAALRQPKETKAQTLARREASRGQADKSLYPGLVAERQRMLAIRASNAERQRLISLDAPIKNSNSLGPYSYTATLEAPRPGADDGLSKPSRNGGQLRYRCGRVTDLAGNDLEVTA
jgi:hypothetical protein